MAAHKNGTGVLYLNGEKTADVQVVITLGQSFTGRTTVEINAKEVPKQKGATET